MKLKTFTRKTKNIALQNRLFYKVSPSLTTIYDLLPDANASGLGKYFIRLSYLK